MAFALLVLDTTTVLSLYVLTDEGRIAPDFFSSIFFSVLRNMAFPFFSVTLKIFVSFS